MQFNFSEQYQNFSNIQLLKIVKQPFEYQPEAVEAAKLILKERNVTREEITYIEQYFRNMEIADAARRGKALEYKKRIGDFFDPVIRPRQAVEPSKWVNILLFIIALQYAWWLYQNIRRFILFLKCRECEIDGFFIVPYLNLIYIPVIFLLLIKRRKWGWILLFSDNLFSLIMSAVALYPLIIYGFLGIPFFYQVAAKLAILFFLWRPAITEYFGVTKNAKRDTVLIVCLAGVLFIFSIHIFFGSFY